jgi:hypothetical protein
MPTEFDRVRSLFAALEKAPLQRFPVAGKGVNAPAVHGVYAIIGPRGSRVVHVGRTVTGKDGLKKRLTDHLRGQSSFVTLHLDRDAARLRGAFWFKYVEAPNPRIRALLEAYAIGQYCPSHIGISRSLLEAKELERKA